MYYLNFTPHDIRLNNGTVFPSNGVVRVSSSFTMGEDGHYRVTYGLVEGLPEPQEGVYYIVSAMVLAASDRADLVAPATGHPDCVRNEKGHIVSVPGFVK